MKPRRGARTVYALFRDPDAVQRAVEGLRANGVSENEIVVMSSEPYEDHEFSHRDSATWLHWIAGVGGVVGLSAATALLVTTQLAWPMVTSGMPTVAWWPNLIIMFELTMLGAILATVITLVVTARLARGSAIYDAEVSDGKVLVGVVNPSESALAGLEAALTAPPGAQLKRI